MTRNFGISPRHSALVDVAEGVAAFIALVAFVALLFAAGLFVAALWELW